MRNKTSTRSATRRPANTLDKSFRRNNVVISRTQREVAQRQQTVTQRQLDQKKALRRHKTTMRAWLLIGVFILVVFLYRMNISRVDLQTNASNRLSAQQLQAYESAILAQYSRHTVAGQAWLLDYTALESDIKRQYPEIERISFSSAALFKSTLNAEIRFRSAVFIWRDASQATQFIDKNGVLFAKSLDPAVNTKKLIQIEDQSGSVLQPGSPVLTTKLVQFVGQLHSKIPPLYGAGSHINRVIVPRSTREVQLQVSGTNYLIKLSSTRPINEEVGELASLLNYLKENKITPASYIDVRIPHKAFYK